MPMIIKNKQKQTVNHSLQLKKYVLKEVSEWQVCNLIVENVKCRLYIYFTIYCKKKFQI